MVIFPLWLIHIILSFCFSLDQLTFPPSEFL
ncbi:putative signal peptide protein [Puccinia sorghi]|uniref:Putative signal peptide protein n=1 Tax=Puccinia sorghi TaxID=27349 RepID=A0A0L6U7X1_9BASI|nr:putative signal peptide protein [Puccinia sorghi]